MGFFRDELSERGFSLTSKGPEHLLMSDGSVTIEVVPSGDLNVFMLNAEGPTGSIKGLSGPSETRKKALIQLDLALNAVS